MKSFSNVYKSREAVEMDSVQAACLSAKIIKNKFIQEGLFELAEHVNHRLANTVDIKSKVEKYGRKQWGKRSAKKRMDQRAEFECINSFQSKGKFCPHYSSLGTGQT